MAIALVANAWAQYAGPANTTATTSAINTTGATLLVVGVYAFSLTEPSNGLTDSKGNSWSALTKKDTGTDSIRWFYAWSADSEKFGPGHTFSYAGAAEVFPFIFVMAFSGARTASDPFDQQSGDGSAGATALQPGSLTPSADNCLVVNFAFGNAGGIENTAGGLTVVDTSTSASPANQFASGYVVQTTAAAINPTWTQDSSNRTAVVQAVFHPSAGGGGGGTPYAVFPRWGSVRR